MMLKTIAMAKNMSTLHIFIIHCIRVLASPKAPPTERALSLTYMSSLIFFKVSPLGVGG
jgi:hypothetical protein